MNLNSPSPFKNELKKYNVLYIIFSLVFIIFTGNDLGTIVSILAGSTGAFLIINIIATFKVFNIRKMIFSLRNFTSRENVISSITLPLTSLNMKVENLPNCIRVTHNKTFYDIFINEDKNTFIIFPEKSLFFRILSRLYINLYKNAIISVPIIAYTIQSQLNSTKQNASI
ncbi:hypothetical protein AXF41_09235 [Clostridium haemolyticum]|uniref:hypothetical protein n=1 Tax=Clostridium haemolyticum TaxID=84025 RepID=UPI0009D523F0|nr:hypothetical protein [Clostridium haemolyticum]OOB75249.1 hypothetical protein AXF41_09235 [Clostridium haemolyticum]